MIPIRDSIPSRTTPVVNYLILAICSLAFLVQLSSGDQSDRIVEQFGMVPLRLSDPSAEPEFQQQVLVESPYGREVRTITRRLAPPEISPILTLITCMFLHGGWMHFLGNMWFLYIFGDNVEDRLGHMGFLLLYLGTGVAAGVSHYVSARYSPIPTIGASGAIAGVMGAYALLYPHARVLAVLPLFVFIQTFVLPAPVFLGIWFVMQMFSGLTTSAGGSSTGVAWWAHIGGFVVGAAFAVMIGRTPLGRDAVTEHRF
jgi:membrane associated rhomboid family serine protease